MIEYKVEEQESFIGSFMLVWVSRVCFVQEVLNSEF